MSEAVMIQPRPGHCPICGKRLLFGQLTVPYWAAGAREDAHKACVDAEWFERPIGGEYTEGWP